MLTFFFFDPDIKVLKAFSWKVQCPPKLYHFLWQILAGCVPITDNLRKRGINCEIGCSRCGALEETINHTLFLCHPARQIWALSQIPTIIWYIWKAGNKKIFDNVDKDPLEILHLAEKESDLWKSAQLELHNENFGSFNLEDRNRVRHFSLDNNYSGYRCFVDGSWKDTDKFSGLGWYCTSSTGETSTLGAANLRRSLSPLHAELEAFLWAMKCMIGADNQDVVFLTDCSDLVEMVSSPTE
ncbi:Hypothetical protein [Arabidopsis thaliana]|uniref:T2P11.5 protein n=1 Tax=Arabidopsis thaliana TaxID=3702 RepID=Q9ZVH1_ARATH|nr:Hypothetical protein [Arabidopsis thaliana]